jgi:hypothetical protein
LFYLTRSIFFFSLTLSTFSDPFSLSLFIAPFILLTFFCKERTHLNSNPHYCKPGKRTLQSAMTDIFHSDRHFGTMILAEMDSIANPLSVLVDSEVLGTMGADKSESDPASAFSKYFKLRRHYLPR